MNLTEDQILSLAPDEASKKSGKDLANPSKWVSKSYNNLALWGECQGSGSKPYQTQIDTVNLAFKCSCPSRKFPCKHGLGLLLLYARQKNSFGIYDAPAWVTDWLNKREEKKEKQLVEEEKPVDEAAQKKRLQARQQKVTDGIEELRRWIKDIVRNGIISMPEKGFAWYEQMAKRMVDAQSPGLANMIRNLADTNFYAEGWQSHFMDQLISLYLVTQGYKNDKSIDSLLQEDIRALIGFTQNQEELKKQSGDVDNWLVLARQDTDIENITTERYWLYGTKSGRYALILQFIVRGQGSLLNLSAGMFIQAELIFFPSAIPMRAIIKKQITSQATPRVSGFVNWQEVATNETNLNCLLPVRNERPYIIENLKPVKYNNLWWLQDSSKGMMQMKNENKKIWKLLSLSGGNAMNMAVIGKEIYYEPVGVWQGEEYTVL